MIEMEFSYKKVKEQHKISYIDYKTDGYKRQCIYNENVKYEVNNNGKGAMYDNETEYKYSYSINENKLILDFENEADVYKRQDRNYVL